MTNKGVVDSSCGGVLMEKSSEEAIELFEQLSDHSQQFHSRGRQGVKSKGMYEVNLNGGSPNQMATVDRKLDMIIKAMALQNISPSQQAAPLQVCAIALSLITLLMLILCIPMQIKSKQTM